MKTKLILPGLSLLIIGCNISQQDNKETDVRDEKNEIVADSSEVYDSLEAIWSYVNNPQTNTFELRQVRAVDRNTLTGETVEKIINKSWPRVQIKFIKTSNDTVFIFIPDSKVLTQQMGSAGAESFMTSTTFSLTELNGINYVSFDFEEGDHARPGVYNRKSWDDNNNQ